jgi:radical SAM protein with 4Fe4S-binding SPASM domain
VTIKIKDISEFRKTVCAVPWMHLAFEPSGKVIPCCLTSTHNYFAGDLNEQSIEEIWNSDNMKSLRKDMINGIEPAICNKCFDQERVTGESGRVHHARSFSNVLKEIPKITEPDGTCTTMNLKYWDFRFSNLCNFKCRSCGPRYSSTWVPDAKKLKWIDEQDKVWNIASVDDLTNFDFLKEQINHVEKIYFAGGEPLMMPEHWQILDMLVEHKRFDVRISYNTNASILTYGGKNVLDYWRLWEPGKIEVWPSIDELGERAELIRAGTNWTKVEENLKAMCALDNIIVRPGMTIGAWNVFRLPEIITYLTELGVIKSNNKFGINYDNFFINMLMDPKHYHVRILSDSFKEEIIATLGKFIGEYNEKYNTNIGPRLDYILHELTTPFDKVAAKRFIEITRQLDQLRNENTFEIIPEMKSVKTALFTAGTIHHTPEV